MEPIFRVCVPQAMGLGVALVSGNYCGEVILLFSDLNNPEIHYC